MGTARVTTPMGGSLLLASNTRPCFEQVVDKAVLDSNA